MRSTRRWSPSTVSCSAGSDVILVLSTPGDEHAQVVLAELERRGAATTLLDLAEFPQRLAVGLSYECGEREFRFGCDERGLDLDDCGAVWWRRPQHPTISSDISKPSHRQFAFNECAEALQGLWHAVDAFWMNDPARDHVAQRKAYQLRVAQEVGLDIPRTLISNCPQEVRRFVDRVGADRVIYKSFSATETEWRETRLLREDALAVLEHVRYAPVIFQEYVEADVDLRVTVVGDEIFPAAIYSQETSYAVDFRMDIAHARIEATSLPEAVDAGLRALMRRLGLVYGAIDLRRTPDGRHVFLEINPAGQFLFVEYFSGQPIAATLARVLHEADQRA
jgi:glutathione synthase/RimK-type ligase-like ATP-grasp enzyme